MKYRSLTLDHYGKVQDQMVEAESVEAAARLTCADDLEEDQRVFIRPEDVSPGGIAVSIGVMIGLLAQKGQERLDIGAVDLAMDAFIAIRNLSVKSSELMEGLSHG